MQATKTKALWLATFLAAMTVSTHRSWAQLAGGPAANASSQYGIPYTDVPAPEELVIYQVNIRAFSKEGNFAGVQSRLDAIRALGANTLYLLPVYPVGIMHTVNSPYCVRDYKAVNSEFGTLHELRTLVEEAHKRRMVVLLDWVANHTAWDHPWIANKSWYQQDAAGNIISPPNTGWKDVAALNYENMDMRKAMIEAMKYWVYQADIDGYRCDAADFVPFNFWQQAIQSLRSIGTHKLLLLAEGKRKDHFTAGFDLEYGMSFYDNLANRIYGAHQSVQSLDILNATEYHDATGDDQVVRYISNHDVDQRDGSPLTILNGRQGSVAAFVVAAYMKGIPMIYDGQEIGCPVKLSFFDKSTSIDWSANPDLLKEYKQIIALRNSSTAIRRGNLRSFCSDDVCAFSKTAGKDEIFVAVNLRNAASTYIVPFSLFDTRWEDAYTNKEVTLPNRLNLQPFQYCVYKKR